MAFMIILKKYNFRIIIKNLTKCNTLYTFAVKNYGKSTNHNLEKMCLRSLTLALTIGLERVWSREVGPRPWPGIFFSPWLLRLCPSTPPPVFDQRILQRRRQKLPL